MDEHDKRGRDDRRSKQRRGTHIRAWADPGGVSAPADCVIVDLSEHGAKISSVGERALPESFELLNEANAKLGEATVMWREGESVGVRLEKRDPEAVNAVKRHLDVGAPRRRPIRRMKI